MRENVGRMKAACIFFFVIMMILILAGTIMMFEDSGYDYYYGYYRSSPETGAMPFVGLFFIFIAFILVCRANEYEYKKLITASVFINIAFILISCSVLLVNSYEAFEGYSIAISGASFIESVCWGLMIGMCVCYAILHNRKPVAVKPTVQQSSQPRPSTTSVARTTNTTTQKPVQAAQTNKRSGGLSEQDINRLKELKELLDLGILSEEEFIAQKKIILGTFVKKEVAELLFKDKRGLILKLKGDRFEFLKDNQVLKQGYLKKDNDKKTVRFDYGDGRSITLSLEGTSLVHSTGAEYNLVDVDEKEAVNILYSWFEQ